MTVLLVVALIGCVVTGVAMARGGKGSVRIHGAWAIALVACALVHAASKLLG